MGKILNLHEYDTPDMITVDTDNVEGIYLKVVDVSGDIITRIDLNNGDVYYVKENYEEVYHMVHSSDNNELQDPVE